MPASRPIADRFDEKVDRSGGPDACWPWTAARNGGGYGIILRDGIPTPAPRVAWELANGPIPAGMYVCHSCDNRPCVNEAHLFLGTQAENMADMVAKGRSLHRFGAQSPRHKLHPEDIPMIRAAYAAGERQADIGARFGVSQVSVSKIVRGAIWSTVNA